MWVPVHNEEWDGDFPLGLDRPPLTRDLDDGQVVFKGNALPWSVGRYEVCEDPTYLVWELTSGFEDPVPSRWKIQCFECGWSTRDLR